VRNGLRAVAVGLIAACSLVGFAAAFAVAASADADAGPAQTTPPPTTPPPGEPPPAEPPPIPPRVPTIPGGVTIGGVDVGGLLPYQASAEVREAFNRRLPVVVTPMRTLRVSPSVLGAVPNVKKAVGRARFSRPGASVPLDVAVSREKIRVHVAKLGREFDTPPVNARLVLRNTTVRAIPSVEGRRLRRVESARALRVAMKTNSRQAIELSFAPVRPKIAEADLGTAIVILRGSNRLRLYRDAKLVRTFGVATGLAAYPTPLGSYEIVNMQRNPWWYPPPSDWAADSDPVPPGPGNPLGTRWMGISAPYVGIHGTPDAASIGYSASHGCVRMRIPDAEWLFRRVQLGTPVFIVSA
jgi:lipoprotein-anchoring transpeptidase ErfK/SrfK